MFGGKRVALFGKGYLQSFKLGPFLQLFLSGFNHPILHLQGMVPHQGLSLLYKFLVLCMFFPNLFMLFLILLDLLTLRTFDVPSDVLC